MSLEIWQEIPAVIKDEQKPLMSTLTDFALSEQVIGNLGLQHAGFSFDLASRCRAFKHGRIVIANPLHPDVIGQRLGSCSDEFVDSIRWFEASNYVLRLAGGRSQGCYGGWRDSYALTVLSL